jgi:RNA polymerase sigma-70 factor (ECF subfamily)
MTDPKHADLLAALRARDPAVAAALWRCFAPTIFRILRRTLGPGAQIEDAAQVVLLCVFERAGRLRPHSDLKQLVVRVTARIAQVELRRRAVSSVLSPLRGRARRDGAARASADHVPAEVTRLYRILDRLGAADRVAFVLHYVEGLEVPDVAAAIGASTARTNGRLRRNLTKVIQRIERDPALLPADQPPRPSAWRAASPTAGSPRAAPRSA